MAGNADVLTYLFPLANIGGVLPDDLAVDGRSLDAAQAQAEILLEEMFPDTSVLLLPSWERICGITPPSGASIQSRQAAVLAQLRSTPGDIKKPYFIALAARLGYTITIVNYVPFMSGWGRAGDSLYITLAPYIWIVTVVGTPVYHFRAGQSAAGEALTSWPSQGALQALLNNLKPADVCMVFAA
jgi:uncharacterized protein YmfQ (DUF2313 family)